MSLLCDKLAEKGKGVSVLIDEVRTCKKENYKKNEFNARHIPYHVEH